MNVTIATRKDVSLREVILRSPMAGLPDAEETLRECMYRSVEVRYGFIDGEVACMWGLIPPSLLSTTAYLWLLTTDIVAEHKFLFIRYSQRYVEEALKTWPTIIGDVLIENRPAQRWLKWLGAEFGPAVKGRFSFTIQAKHG